MLIKSITALSVRHPINAKRTRQNLDRFFLRGGERDSEPKHARKIAKVYTFPSARVLGVKAASRFSRGSHDAPASTKQQGTPVG